MVTSNKTVPYYITGMDNDSKSNISQLISVREAADILAVSHYTLLRHCRAGKIAHYRIFGRIKFSRQQIEDYKLGAKVEPGPKVTNYILMLSSNRKDKPAKTLYKATREIS